MYKIINKMDELMHYLQSNTHYYKSQPEQILNTKIMINKNHIKNIIGKCLFNIINLFEQYGYVFTNDDYIFLIIHNESIFKYISDNNKTNELCELAVQYYGLSLRFVPQNKKTVKICKIAVQNNGEALPYVPKFPINGEFRKKPLLRGLFPKIKKQMKFVK